MDPSESTSEFVSLRRFQYEAIPGIFVHSEPPATLSVSRPLSAFGLKEYASATRWRDMKDRIAHLQRLEPRDTRYIVCWLARHGQAWHNMNTFVGRDNTDTIGWDGHTADPPLTPLGEAQAKDVNSLWKAEIQQAHEEVFVDFKPTRLFCSPLTRALATMELTFEGFLLDEVAARAPEQRPLVLEGLREVMSPFTHDKRSSKSEILSRFPGVQIEDSFTEEASFGHALL
ncbi:unnamed protein product [Rhizoctonia solani]|uniref:Phosphomutase PMU1 n=1 Tax=Rhizoctonia solani TaxID=456999 RepID=A0A8H2WX83_9AGAM|nr:unnamed protein product [Rhizoctonia solani]